MGRDTEHASGQARGEARDLVYAGIDIGGTSTKIGLVARSGLVLARRRLSSTEFATAGDLADACCAAVDELLAGAPLAGIGVAMCGYVTPGGLPELTNVPYLDGYPLVRHLGDRFGVPVTIDNDANAAALAEHEFGAGRGASRLIVVAVGTGIGIGAILDGRLVRFTGGTTGNIGHAIVDPDSEERCGLGCRGCLETKATSRALERRAARVARAHPATPLGRRREELGAEALTAADVKAAADRGDRFALNLLREAGRWLGVGLATFAATFSPDVIVIGGGMAEMGPLFLDAAVAAFEDTTMPYTRRDVKVLPAALGNDAGMIGAVCGLW